MTRHTLHVGTMDSYAKALMASEILRLSKLDKGEAALMGHLRSLLYTSYWTALAASIPLDIELDTLGFELESGRAHITIFHADGTASVIEVKDGSRGRNHVMSGIGQVGQYAATTGAVIYTARKREVRLALLWSATGEPAVDASISLACEAAGVIPMPWRTLESMCAGRDAVMKSMEF